MLKSTTHFFRFLKGFKSALVTQWAFRFELVIFILSIPCAVLLGETAAEYAMLISSVMIILMVELLNSAIETVIDRIGLEYHQLSGIAKDLASAATMLACINAVIIWMIIFCGRYA